MPGPGPGKIEAVPGVFTNITTDPERSRQGFRALCGGRLGGHGGRHSVHRLDLRDRHRQDQRAKRRRSEGCKGCKVLSIEDTPIGDLSNRMGQLTTSLLVEIRQGLDLLDRRQRPLLRLLGAVAAIRRRRSGRPAIPADLGGRRFGAGLPAHPRQAISDRHRRRAAAPAWLAVHRRNEPRLRRPAAERLRRARPSVHQRQHRQGRRRAEHVRSRQRLQAINTRRSGA